MRVEEERMKESWMDKLIELRWNKLIKPLEKYLLELAKRNPIFKNFNVNLPWVSVLWVHETILISEKFWFIKWLFENDKIDLDKTSYLETCCMCWWFARYWKVDGLIMKLSISSSPIEDLIFYLKK